jgi:hypothetical protein
MTKSRVTINVNRVRIMANNALDSHLTSRGEREGIATLLEAILHDTGNYRGFSYLASEYLPADEQTIDQAFSAASATNYIGKSLSGQMSNVLKSDYDSSRRYYS